MTIAKPIVSGMLEGHSLDESNYDSWICKIKYLYSESNAFDFITQEVNPQSATSPEEIQWYSNNVKKDHSEWYLMLSCMIDDLVHLFEVIESAQAMWEALKKRYGIMSPTRLHTVELKDES